MRLVLALFLLSVMLPAHAGKPKSCGGDKPAPPPNPAPTITKKHNSSSGLSFAEGAAVVIGVGLVCNLLEGCKLTANPP
jgi:hypothetical protein